MFHEYSAPYQGQHTVRQNNATNQMKRRSFSVPRLAPLPMCPPQRWPLSPTTDHTTRARSRAPISHHLRSNPNLVDKQEQVSRSNAEWSTISGQLEDLSLSSSDSVTSVDFPVQDRTTIIVQVKNHMSPQPESHTRNLKRRQNALPNPIEGNWDKRISGGVRVLPSSPMFAAQTASLPSGLSRSVPSLSETNRSLQPNQFELSSLQVFRQPKYKNRYKSQNKIQQLNHVDNSAVCKKQLDFVHENMQSADYENQDKLSSFQKCPTTAPPQSKCENIYEEIDESKTSDFKTMQQLMCTRRQEKKVTFQLPSRALHDQHDLTFNKKIIGGRLYGMAEVVEPLRSSSDQQRRTMARMCYRAVRLKYTSYSLSFLGKVDVSRAGEEIFVVMERDAFEIRDSDGLMVARHRTRDISVITGISDESRVVVYIGKCRLMGRIAMVIKFNKSKHVTLLNNLFNNHHPQM